MPQTNPNIPIWISLLLDEWEAKGHRLGIDLQLRLANYIALRGHEALMGEEWRARLAAILCHNKEDQLAFYESFDQFWEEAKQKASKKIIEPEDSIKPIHPNKSKSEEPEDEVFTSVKPEQETYRLQTPQTKRRGPVHIELSFPPNPARYWNTAPLDQAVRPLLEKEWTHVQEWDPLKSIKATIRAGGIPQLVHRRRKLAPRYLFLIDQRSRYDHLAGMYQDLVLELRSRDLDVEWFYYDTLPHRCWYERRDTSTHTFIERIFSEYENYKLIIVGEPTGLLELPNLRPANLLLDMIDHFPSIALLDTRPTVQWNAEESALNQCMPVVPASAEGLASLIKQWQSAELLTPAYWRLEHQESSVPSLQFEDEASLQEVISNLKVYLGRTGFSWLCAALVYPELHYELTALLNDESIAPNPELAEFDQNAIWLRSLHRISRLSWFRTGSVPEKIREQLRSWLPDEQATEVRRQLLEVLELEENRPPKDSYAAASHEFAVAWLDFEKEYLKQSTDTEKANLLDIFKSKADTVPLSDINDPLGRQYLYDINSTTKQTDQPRILWVDDKPDRIKDLRDDLSGEFGMQFHLATNLEQALVQLDRIPFQMVITDYSRKGDPQGGEHLLDAMQARELETPLIVFTSKELVQRIGAQMLSNGAAAVVSEIDALYEQIKKQLGAETVVAEQSQTQQTTSDNRPMTLNGVVKDTNNDPLIGTSIIEQGTPNGTITDSNGAYQLTLSSRDAVLEFSYVGYKTISKEVGTSTVMDVVMELEASSENEDDPPSSDVPKKMFISYSNNDKIFADELERHLSVLVRRGEIDIWDDSQIKAGDDWEEVILDNLKNSALIVYLVSADFLASNYINDVERKMAEQMREDKGAIIIPIIVRECMWREEDFARYQVLPLDNSGGVRPISSFENKDEAYTNVVKRIQELIRNGQAQDIETLATEERIEQIRDLIAIAKLEEAIQEMQELASEIDEGDFENTIFLISGQYNRNERDNNQGLIKPDDYKRTLGRISSSLLEILKEMEYTANTGTVEEDAKVEPAQTTVLMLPSNQTSSGRLSYQEESQLIRDNLNSAGLVESFQMLMQADFSAEDFAELLATPNLDIIHFSDPAHNASAPFTKASKQQKSKVRNEQKEGLYLFAGKAGHVERTSSSFLQKALIQAQESANNNIKAVILNKCFTPDIAQAISQTVEYVVGSDHEVKDEAAIAFAQAFYGYIGKSGKTSKAIDIENAFRNGLNAALAYSEPRNRFFLYKNGIQLERSTNYA